MSHGPLPPTGGSGPAPFRGAHPVTVCLEAGFQERLPGRGAQRRVASTDVRLLRHGLCRARRLLPWRGTWRSWSVRRAGPPGRSWSGGSTGEPSTRGSPPAGSSACSPGSTPFLRRPTGGAPGWPRLPGHGVVSHSSALALWELVPPLGGPIHLTVDPTRSARGSAGGVLHRAPDLAQVTRRVCGLPVTCVERAVIDTWGAPGADRHLVRAAAISAVRQRRCAAADLEFELARRPRLPGRRELETVVRLLAEGCRSELEIWGCQQVLRGPGMPAFVQQQSVVVAGKRFFLDAAYDEVLLAAEMDGAAWHGSRQQRERDIRRDALLATIGWQTLRFSYARMTADPLGCRREVLAVSPRWGSRRGRRPRSAGRRRPPPSARRSGRRR
jgi:very-short-patch-repair endonuclease